MLTHLFLVHVVVIVFTVLVLWPLALWAGRKWPTPRQRELRSAWMMGIAVGFYFGLGTVWIGGWLGSLIGPGLV